MVGADMDQIGQLVSFIFRFIKISTKLQYDVYKGYYMSAHVKLNLLNGLRKIYKMREFYLIFATRLINAILQENEC